MFHEIALFAALAVFCAGMILKISAWFRYSVGPANCRLPNFPPGCLSTEGNSAYFFQPKSTDARKSFLPGGDFSVEGLEGRYPAMAHAYVHLQRLYDALLSPRAGQLGGGPLLSRIFCNSEPFSVSKGRGWSAHRLRDRTGRLQAFYPEDGTPDDQPHGCRRHGDGRP